MSETIQLAAICMTSTSDKETNVDAAISLVREAARAGADWIQLPEVFPYHGSYDRAYELAESEGGPLYQTLSQLARELGVVLFAGTMGERPDGEKHSRDELYNAEGHRRVFNTCYVFGRDGKRLAKYRKSHLFNLYDPQGRPRYSETDGFIPGADVSTVEIDGLRVGLSICYDLRFPELYTRMVDEGGALDVIVCPSAFTKKTGEAHWELLVRARAVERQCYVFAANQGGHHGRGKESYGHAMIADPWGQVLASTGEDPGVAYATLNPEKIREDRAKLPAWANRRPDLYHPSRESADGSSSR